MFSFEPDHFNGGASIVEMVENWRSLAQSLSYRRATARNPARPDGGASD